MANVKYLEERVSSKGITTWAGTPSLALKRDINAIFFTTKDKARAVDICTKWSDDFEEFKKGITQKKYISDNSVAGLVDAFYETSNYMRLSTNSKASYKQLLNYALEMRVGMSNTTLGQTLHRHVTAKMAEKIHTQLQSDVSSHRAVHVCKVLKRVWFVGWRLGLTQSNPFSKMGLVSLPVREVRWEQDHIDIFVAKADEMGLWSVGTLALLCYHLCQRVGDMRQLTWDNYENSVFKFVQEKSRTVKNPPGKIMILPSNRELDERLSVLPRRNRGNFIILNERTERPYTKWAYKSVAEVRKASGLPFELKISDLRRTGATELGEAGCTTDEIMSQTGHIDRDVVNVYVKQTPIMAVTASEKRQKRFGR